MRVRDISAVSTALPWQQEQWARLVAQLDQQQLPHALLLCGAPYSGKASLAMALARLLLCHKPEGGHNCGQCHACELSMSGSHGDFRWLEPEEGSRVIKVDQVRQLVEFSTKTASLGRRKLIVLSPAESMNIAAANALLKSLEEPSPETYIILVCHRLHGLPATIRSRCQILKLLMPNREASLRWLDLRTGNTSDSEKSLGLARGRALFAEQLYQNASMDYEETVQVALRALSSGTGSVQELAAIMVGEPLEDMLSQLYDCLQRLVLKMNSAKLTAPSTRAIYSLSDEVLRLQGAVYSGANPNRQLLVDALSARFEMVLT